MISSHFRIYCVVNLSCCVVSMYLFIVLFDFEYGFEKQKLVQSEIVYFHSPYFCFYFLLRGAKVNMLKKCAQSAKISNKFESQDSKFCNEFRFFDKVRSIFISPLVLKNAFKFLIISGQKFRFCGNIYAQKFPQNRWGPFSVRNRRYNSRKIHIPGT